MADEKTPPKSEGIAPGEPIKPPELQAPLPDQIILFPQSQPKVPAAAPPARTASSAPKPGEMKDGTREIIETVVFVVVLVLLLKTFLAEAFVIPTGSMATTLLGYHREVTCEKCGYRFLVNASSEADPQDGRAPSIVTRCYCPICRYLNVLQRPQGVVP
jgi:hypothetical protein